MKTETQEYDRTEILNNPASDDIQPAVADCCHCGRAVTDRHYIRRQWRTAVMTAPAVRYSH